MGSPDKGGLLSLRELSRRASEASKVASALSF